MTHRLPTNYAKNYCNRTLIVKVIVENVDTCFFGGTRCRSNSHSKPTINSHISYDINIQIFLSYHRDNLLQVMSRRLQQLFTVAAPTLAVADVRAETNDMKPQSNTV